MAPQTWKDVEELLRYLAGNWPFDPGDPCEEKVIPLDAKADGDTPLHFVAAWDDAHGIELLVRAGAFVDEVGDIGFTPLATAVRGGNVAAARALLQHGASPNITTEFGESPHQMAIHNGTEEMKDLFRSGAI